jgi:hypothetical protein
MANCKSELPGVAISYWPYLSIPWATRRQDFRNTLLPAVAGRNLLETPVLRYKTSKNTCPLRSVSDPPVSKKGNE